MVAYEMDTIILCVRCLYIPSSAMQLNNNFIICRNILAICLQNKKIITVYLGATSFYLSRK